MFLNVNVISSLMMILVVFTFGIVIVFELRNLHNGLNLGVQFYSLLRLYSMAVREGKFIISFPGSAPGTGTVITSGASSTILDPAYIPLDLVVETPGFIGFKVDRAKLKDNQSSGYTANNQAWSGYVTFQDTGKTWGVMHGTCYNISGFSFYFLSTSGVSPEPPQ